MKKKIAIGIGVLIGLFLIAAVALPFLIDVDKFRPQIVTAVNDKINGEFKLGKLSLSIWTGVKVTIESLSIRAKDRAKPIIETNTAYLEVPLWSLVTFSPNVTVVLLEPKLDVIKKKNEKLNVMELVKESPPGAPAPAKSSESGGLPAVLAKASAGLRIEKGYLAYTDEITGNKYEVNGFDVDVENLGLNRTVKAAMTLPLKVTSAEMHLDGVVEAHAQVNPTLSSGIIQAAGTMEVDATDLAFSLNHDMVKKTAKMPLTIKMEFKGSPAEAEIKNLDFQFADIAANAKGDFVLQPQKSVHLELHSSNIHLASFEKIVPMLEAYHLSGVANLNADVKGPIDNIAAHGELDVKGGKAEYPALLKNPLGFELKTTFTEKSLVLSNLSISAPGTQASLKGSVQNFKAPQFEFALNSKEFDLDRLLKSESAAKKTAWIDSLQVISEAEAAPTHTKKATHPVKVIAHSAAHSKAEPAVAANTGNPMIQLAKNPILANASGVVHANMSKITAKGGVITDLMAKAVLKNLVLTIESLSLKTCEGSLSAKAEANLKTAGLDYNTSGSLKGMSAKAALTAYVPKFQNSLEGKINASWSLKGTVYPQSAILRMLAGSVNLGAENGKLSSLDMQESIKGVLSKLPLLKGVTPPKIDSGFKSMRADMKFSGGVIDANPLELVGDAQGVTVKGKSKIQPDLIQDTYVDVYDPNRLLPKEISNGKDVAMALHITGPITGPQTDYGYTVGKLAKNVVKNKGAEMLGNELQKALGGKAGDGSGNKPTGDAVKGLLKGLGL